MRFLSAASHLLVCTLCIAGCGGCDGTGVGPDPSDVWAEAGIEDDADVSLGEAGPEAEGGGPPCVPGADELCDGRDNDCDTKTDEGFDFRTDPDNCGACNAVCRPENADGGCQNGVCAYECDEGWFDINGSGVDGCEYQCGGSEDAEVRGQTCADRQDNDCDGRTDNYDPDCNPCPPEFCNERDDDCDGLVDEDFDFDFDPQNCGACGNVCPTRPNAVPACVLRVCGIRCEAGWANLDGNLVNGCEVACVPSGTADESTCDGRDDDCDGRTDEDYVGWPCGEGLCRRRSVCGAGRVEPCTPGTPLAPTDATCNRADDDCDGGTDEEAARCECYDDAACEDGVACTVGRCVGGLCEHTPDAALCDDGSLCTGTETCDSTLGCLHGTLVDCSDRIDCTVDECDPLTGRCSWRPDHTRCPGGELCDPDRSEDASGCAPPPMCPSNACDDGDACNGLETCSPRLLCVPGVPVDCDDGIACTRDWCNPSDGSCTNTPPDIDRDTYADADCGGTDCDDRDPSRYPGRTESCDGVDQDCDAMVDEGDICGPMPNAATSTCIAGQCVPNCNAGWGDCDGVLANGCETSLTTLTHCGACGVPCDLARATESCLAGTCVITACDPGWGNCNGTDADGCEASLATLENCGACTNVCPARPNGTPRCTGGACDVACNPGWGNCNGNAVDGCETNLMNNISHCGACGSACPTRPDAVTTCTNGVCGFTMPIITQCTTRYGCHMTGCWCDCGTPYILSGSTECTPPPCPPGYVENARWCSMVANTGTWDAGCGCANLSCCIRGGGNYQDWVCYRRCV